MALYIQSLSEEDAKQIETLLCAPEKDLPVERLLIVRLSAAGKSVSEISKVVNLHRINVRKWIHRYATQGLDGLRTGKSPGRPCLFTNTQRTQIYQIAHTNPRHLGLNYSRWSLQRLRRYLIAQGIVDQISIETIRQIRQSRGLAGK